jgi:hypothetical protein
MARGQFGFPVFVGPCVPPSQYTLKLFIGPRIKVDRFNSADMCTHSTVDARAADADKNAQIPTRPSWMLVPLAVCTDFVALEFD